MMWCLVVGFGAWWMLVVRGGLFDLRGCGGLPECLDVFCWLILIVSWVLD